MQLIIIMHVLISNYRSVLKFNAHSRVFTGNNSYAHIMLKQTQMGVPNVLGGTSGKDPKTTGPI